MMDYLRHYVYIMFTVYDSASCEKQYLEIICTKGIYLFIYFIILIY